MVTVIFKNLHIKEYTSKLNKFVKNNRIFKYVTIGALSLGAVILTFLASGVTFGYTVTLSDEVVAVVSSRADYEAAEKKVASKLDKAAVRKTVVSPEFGLTLTVADKLNTTQEVVEAIINNNDEIVEATALVVDGEVKLCVENDQLQKLINARLSQFDAEGVESTSKFAAEVKTEKGYFLKNELVTVYEAHDAVNQLDVETVAVTTRRVKVPHETRNIKTAKKPVGYSAVNTKGVDGITEKTERVVMLNGKVVSKTKLSQKVIKKQVTEVITVGTGVNYVSASQKAQASSAGFICPLSRGKFIISAYYGDGRNHKGIDLAAPQGTPIFAAQGGRVTYAGYDGDYGYNVIIQHSNGLKTRYAHANALCVKKGQVVSQGDMIATVGTTGWSTGNHLHFEVIIGGNRVNPAPYIGLR